MRRLCCGGSCEANERNTMDTFSCVSRCQRSAPTITHRIGVSDWHLFSFFFRPRLFLIFWDEKWSQRHGFDENSRPSVGTYCNYRQSFHFRRRSGRETSRRLGLFCWNLHDGRRCREEQTTQWQQLPPLKSTKAVCWSFVNERVSQ